MTRLNTSLEDLASRGQPRGALDVFGAATGETRTITVSEEAGRKPTPWFAFVTGFVVVAVVGLLVANALRTNPAGPPSPFGCQMPPASERQDMPDHMSVDPGVVAGGTTARLTIKTGTAGAGYSWQCWDGTEWINTHFLFVTYNDWNPDGPQTVVWNEDTGVELIGFLTPAELTFLVPDSPAGVYRILDRQGVTENWAIVEIGTSDADPPPTTATPDPPTQGEVSYRVIRIVETTLPPDYTHSGDTAGPADLTLADGTRLHMPANTPLPFFCNVIAPHAATPVWPCFGVAAIAPDGETLLRFHVFASDPTGPGSDETVTYARVSDLRFDGTQAVIDGGLRLELSKDHEYRCDRFGMEVVAAGPVSWAWALYVDDLGLVTETVCFDEIHPGWPGTAPYPP